MVNKIIIIIIKLNFFLPSNWPNFNFPLLYSNLHFKLEAVLQFGRILYSWVFDRVVMRGFFLDDWECTRSCMNTTQPCLGVMIAHGRALYRNRFWLGHTAMSPFDTAVSLCYRILIHSLAFWSGFLYFFLYIFLVF